MSAMSVITGKRFMVGKIIVMRSIGNVKIA